MSFRGKKLPTLGGGLAFVLAPPLLSFLYFKYCQLDAMII